MKPKKGVAVVKKKAKTKGAEEAPKAQKKARGGRQVSLVCSCSCMFKLTLGVFKGASTTRASSKKTSRTTGP